MREQMRQITHEANPDPQHREAKEQSAESGDREHHEGTVKPQSDQRTRPEPHVRRRPGPDGRQKPTDDEQRMREPPRHRRNSYRLRASTTRANTISVTVK